MVATIEQNEQIRQLAKANRILQRKLERAERTRRELEATNEKKESLLRKIIQELRDSEASLAERQQIITDLKATQSQLVQTEKMSSLGQLVAGIAHEINNPINFVWGNIQYVEEYGTDLLRLADAYQQGCLNTPPAAADILEEIDLEFMQADFPQLLQSMRLGSERIRAIVLSLRNFSRLDEATNKEANLHEGIDNTLLILGHRLKANSDHPDIQVIKEYGDLPLVECYPGQLNQVFMNLIANAIDACEDTNKNRTFEDIVDHPNQITIQTQQLSSDSLQIKITDNGTGMTTEVRDRLFDPFFTTKAVGKGTGLGLSISYQIITQKHHGQLDCESTLGQGSTFIVTLPLHLSAIDNDALNA